MTTVNVWSYLAIVGLLLITGSMAGVFLVHTPLTVVAVAGLMKLQVRDTVLVAIVVRDGRRVVSTHCTNRIGAAGRAGCQDK